MSNAVAAFKSWLDAYGQAWINCDPQASAALFTEDGSYQVTPFLKPMCGRKAIYQYWSEIARTQENIAFEYEILVAKAERNIANWSASFVIVPQGLPTKLDGMFLISLDARGRCTSLREWWHKLQE
jgi:ketosteroid isomerase-like protein